MKFCSEDLDEKLKQTNERTNNRRTKVDQKICIWVKGIWFKNKLHTNFISWILTLTKGLFLTLGQEGRSGKWINPNLPFRYATFIYLTSNRHLKRWSSYNALLIVFSECGESLLIILVWLYTIKKKCNFFYPLLVSIKLNENQRYKKDRTCVKENFIQIEESTFIFEAYWKELI
jgi:hypothetical protein